MTEHTECFTISKTEWVGYLAVGFSKMVKSPGWKMTRGHSNVFVYEYKGKYGKASMEFNYQNFLGKAKYDITIRYQPMTESEK